ncbi:UDP-N-acetylglucosamine 2-epimerase [Lachnospiraceae bacterium KM106-2]|nr:UDP-N-acetylglucosamine 2-epimerase [Lachnospiraceae bacterium KM106-2]
MNNKRKIVFLTGTRADYGKLKSLIHAVHDSEQFEEHIFVTGMHMLSKYGSTYREIEKDGFSNLYTYINQTTSTAMDITLSNTITGFSNYVAEVEPAAIVVHGDRLEALAGAIVGAFNNIKVFHIEGGEVSGTIDESIRHAISKFSHYHFVSNEMAKKRIMQLGEPSENIFIFGSPDIDIMYSDSLPDINTVKEHYEIPFDQYNIVMYHPVTTTPLPTLRKQVKELVAGLLLSNENYVVIYPNNDSGTDAILEAYESFKGNEHFRMFPSMRFESFLTLLKNASMIIGNSSSGIREACIYGTPAIDMGNRQQGRYDTKTSASILHIDENAKQLLDAIQKAHEMILIPESHFGEGNSDEIFINTLSSDQIWDHHVQKKFIDVNF